MCNTEARRDKTGIVEVSVCLCAYTRRNALKGGAKAFGRNAIFVRLRQQQQKQAFKNKFKTLHIHTKETYRVVFFFYFSLSAGCSEINPQVFSRGFNSFV